MALVNTFQREKRVLVSRQTADALFVLGLAFLVVLAPSEERPDRATEDVALPTPPARTARHATDERLVAVRDPVVPSLLDDRRTAERSREGRGELGIRK